MIPLRSGCIQEASEPIWVTVDRGRLGTGTVELELQEEPLEETEPPRADMTCVEPEPLSCT